MQDHENTPLPPDEPISSASEIESIEETISSGTEVESMTDVPELDTSADVEEELPKEESRSRRAFRKFIRWTVGLLIVFGLGFLTAVFTIYNAKVSELGQSQNDLNVAGSTISELKTQINAQQDEINHLNAQINTLDQKIETLEGEKQELSEQQDRFNLHIALLKARVDVVSAQVELYDQNPAQARVLLENTGQTLIAIESLLPDDLKDVVAPLQTRLELAVGEIDADPETAISDLSILAGDLLEIENALFND